MSISPARKFRIGIIASKSFDSPNWFEKRFTPNVDKISHLYTNGVNQLVIDFAKSAGLACTIYPIKGNSAPWSNSRIIENSDKVYILATPDSHNSQQAKSECEKQGVKFEVVEFTVSDKDEALASIERMA